MKVTFEIDEFAIRKAILNHQNNGAIDAKAAEIVKKELLHRSEMELDPVFLDKVFPDTDDTVYPSDVLAGFVVLQTVAESARV